MEQLYQLVYTSVRKKICDEREIEKILDSCKRNNLDKDIIKLYDLIKTDPRHEKVILLSYGPIKKRIFPSWQMAYKNVTKDEVNFLTDAEVDYKKAFKEIMNGEKVEGSTSAALLSRLLISAK